MFPENALAPISVTVDGIFTVVSVPVYFVSTPFVILKSLDAANTGGAEKADTANTKPMTKVSSLYFFIETRSLFKNA